MRTSILDDEGAPLEGVLDGDGVFRCRALGFGLRVPIGWHLLTGDAFTIAALQVAAAERRLVITKYPEPHAGLNPNLTLIIRSRPQMGPDTPLGMVRMALATMPHMLRQSCVEQEPLETTFAGRAAAAARVCYEREVIPGETCTIRSYIGVVFHGDVMYQLSFSASAEGADAYDQGMELFFETLELGDEPTSYPWALLVANGLMQRYAAAPIRSRHQFEAAVGMALSQAGLNRLASHLAPMVVPCFRMLRTPRQDDEIPIGSSKIGGCADLPEWTAWPEAEGYPLAFVAQIRFSDFAEQFPGCPLPSDGLLSIFCSVRSPGRQDPRACRVLYHAAGTRDLHRLLPKDTEPHPAPYPAAKIEFFEAISLPSPHSPLLQRLALDDQEMETYVAFHTGLLGSVEDPFHQILGYGTECGEDDDCAPGRETTAHDLEDKLEAWVLLLQLGADPETGLGWTGGSLLDVWVRRDDLESRRFLEPLMILHGEPSLDAVDEEDGEPG